MNLGEGSSQQTPKHTPFLSAQRRYENIRVPPNEIKKRICYECGDVLNELTDYQEHLLAHEVVNISYQLYHRERLRSRPVQRTNGKLALSSDDSDREEQIPKDRRKQVIRRKRHNTDNVEGNPRKITKRGDMIQPQFMENFAIEHETEFSNDSIPQTINSVFDDVISPFSPKDENPFFHMHHFDEVIESNDKRGETSRIILPFESSNTARNSEEMAVESVMFDLLDQIESARIE